MRGEWCTLTGEDKCVQHFGKHQGGSEIKILFQFHESTLQSPAIESGSPILQVSVKKDPDLTAQTQIIIISSRTTRSREKSLR